VGLARRRRPAARTDPRAGGDGRRARPQRRGDRLARHTVERLRELLDDVDSYRRNRANFERNASRRLIAQRLDLEALIRCSTAA